MKLPKPVTKTGGTFLDRPFKELIDERAMDLAELKMQMFNNDLEKRDDIALVRYLASFGSVKNTLEALRAAEAVCEEKAEVLRAAEEGRPLPCAERVEPCQKVMSWKVSEDHVWYIIRVAHVDCPRLLKTASVDEIIDYGLHLCRSMWLWVDRTSRRLGRVRKYDVVLDFHGYSFTSWEKVPPAAYRQAMNRMSELSEVLHPLSMGTSTVIGLPGASVAKRLIAIARPFLPKSLTEAQLCLGNRQKQPITMCPYVMSNIMGGPGGVPIFLGGSCPVSGATLENVREDLAAAPAATESSAPSSQELERFEALLAEASDADAAAKAASESGLAPEALSVQATTASETITGEAAAAPAAVLAAVVTADVATPAAEGPTDAVAPVVEPPSPA